MFVTGAEAQKRIDSKQISEPDPNESTTVFYYSFLKNGKRYTAEATEISADVAKKKELDK
jgi:hypothetical protein